MSSKIIQGNMMIIVLSGEIRGALPWTRQTPRGENPVLTIPGGTVINDLMYKPGLTILNTINKVFTVATNLQSLTGDFHLTNCVI